MNHSPNTNHAPSRRLSDTIDADLKEERRRALRALLLRCTWVADAEDQEDFLRIRRSHTYLGDWFTRYTGWTLIVRGDSIRLVKSGTDLTDPTRGAIDIQNQSAFSRRKYVLWCIVLSILHAEGRQTTLRRLAEQAIRTVEAEPRFGELGIAFDLKSVDTRRGLISVIRLLLDLGVLTRVEGDEQGFVSGEGDCLYNVRTALLSDLLHVRRPLNTIEAHDTRARLNAISEELQDEGDDDAVRNRRIEQRLIRRLLDDPVVYYEELTEREFAYWQSQRPRLLAVIEEATGLVGELRSEGVAMLDPDDDLTDVNMPEAGTVGHATLLVGEYLAQFIRGAPQVEPGVAPWPATMATSHGIPMEMLEAHLARLAHQHARHWRKGITEPAETRRLLEEILQRLEKLRLIRRVRERIEPLPAVARFAAADPREDAPTDGEDIE